MTRSDLAKLALFGAAAVVLAGCGGGGGGSSSTATTTATTPTLEQSFGTAFNTDYQASPNSQPAVPQAGDVIALTLTAQPMSLH